MQLVAEPGFEPEAVIFFKARIGISQVLASALMPSLPQRKLLFVASSLTPWGGECGSSSSFLIVWIKLCGITFSLRCCSSKMHPEASYMLQAACESSFDLQDESPKSLTNQVREIFNNSTALASCTSPTQQTARHVFVFFFPPPLLLSWSFFYLFADSWFGGRRWNQLIEDLQNHKCGY